MSEERFRSNLHGMRVPREHDPTLFAEVHWKMPVLRGFPRAQRPAKSS